MTPEQLKHLERCARGESHGSSKLTVEAVLEIRKAERRRSVYAKRYGVCVRTIAHIQNRTSWAWLLPDGSIDITLRSGKYNDNRKS